MSIESQSTKGQHPRKTRNAEQTQERLLKAATQLFSQRGYGQVGMREIAAEAEVTVGLVNRYFGTKAKLFETVVKQALDNHFFFAVERSQAGRYWARYVVSGQAKQVDDVRRIPVSMLLRSSGEEPAASILRGQLSDVFVRELSAWMGGEEAELRAGLICSYIFGVTILKHFIGLDCLNQDQHIERLIDVMAPMLQSLIDG